MAIYQYFKKQTALPSSMSPLSSSIPSKSISFANKEVKSVLESKARQGTKRGSYSVYTEEEKAKISKRAAEMGVSRTIKHFSKEFQDRPLKESTVRTWMNQYKKELALLRGAGDMSELGEVTKLPAKKRGRPLLLGENLDKQVQDYIKTYRESGAVVNTAIVMATGIGIVSAYDSNLLQENGGHITCSKEWARNLLRRLGYVKRWASTKMKVTPDDFDALKSQSLFDVKCIIELEEIPKALVVNWDHTGINYVPVGQWMMAPEGAK